MILHQQESFLRKLHGHFSKKEKNEGEWEFKVLHSEKGRQGYFTKENTDPNSDDWAKVKKIYDRLAGAQSPALKLIKINQVYNKDLINSFVGQWRITTTRLVTSGNIFGSATWKDKDDEQIRNMRANVVEKYKQLVMKMDWNTDDINPIVLTAHGTNLGYAEKICLTGFANLSMLDTGFYGAGIYFTTNAEYCIPYFTQNNPVLILSWVIPGNIYPVIERHDSHSTLLGKPLIGGYGSHYILTSKDGTIHADPSLNIYDEIVIQQETQICPAFILEFSTEGIAEAQEGMPRRPSPYAAKDKEMNKISNGRNIQKKDIKIQQKKTSNSKIIVDLNTNADI